MNPFDNLTLEQLEAAAASRVSTRAYAPQDLDTATIDALKACVDAMNSLNAGFEATLVGPLPDAGAAFGVSSAMFAGTWHWTVVFRSKKTPEAHEHLGFEAEKLVLLAEHLGLGSCWIAGSYKPELAEELVPGALPLWGIIPLGYKKLPVPLKQKTIRAGIRARDKKLQELIESPVAWADLPAWVQNTVRAMQAGPSAVNQQPVRLTWQDDVLRAYYVEPQPRHQDVDFGIAKLHAAIGAGMTGAWEFGQNGAYVM